MRDQAMAPYGVTDRVVRPLGGEAALTFSAAAPIAMGRPFFVSLILALGLSSVIAALGRQLRPRQSLQALRRCADHRAKSHPAG